jgi:prepilin-type N-terminal cleavage/methylation domain-containing protein
MRRGFTLIEILIAAAIGVLMITLVTGALVGIRRITERNQVLTSLHEDAATINRNLLTDVGSSFAGAKWEAAAQPGADGAWGTGDEVVTVTWMTALSDPKQETYEFGRDARHDLTWCRLRWIGGGAGKPSRLMYARNSGFWYGTYRPPGGGGVTIHMDPLPRRDRRRDMNDNDLRHIPGLQPAEYAAIAMPGDGSDIDQQLLPLHAPTVTVEDLRIAWIDRGGWRTVLTPGAGIAQYDQSGAAMPLSGGPWDNQQRLGVDGVFLDSRSHTAPAATRSVAAARPQLLQVSFTLVEYRERAGSSDPASLRIDLSLPTGAELPLP